MSTPPEPVYFYFEFINKIILAGRGDGTNVYFQFGTEIDRHDFIKFANRFIEDYHATVPPEFAINHRIKFSFVTILENGLLRMRRDIRSAEIDDHSEINGGILFIDHDPDNVKEDSSLDGSIFRQACFIRRERLKLLLTVAGFTIGVASLIISAVLKK
jgi:hypothetical protein